MTATPLHSPKVVSGDRANPRWYRFYAMFSEEFARSVIARASLSRGAVVLDPWVGSGTSSAIASLVGCRAVGVDVNPVMVNISWGRLLDRTVASACAGEAKKRFVGRVGDLLPDDPLLDWFGPQAAKALRGWEHSIRLAYPDRSQRSEAGFLLTCLFEVAVEFARPYRSKNPTWLKRPVASMRVNPTTGQVTNAVLVAANRRAGLCYHRPAGADADVMLGTSVGLDLPDASVDLVLTSPPYCTRIDYAVSTAIELSVLGKGRDGLSSLRDQSMGTSTIRGQLPMSIASWGRTCLDLLGRVEGHDSKSSRNYYYKNFLQYFDDLRRSLGEVSRCLKTGRQAVVVVQDSVYKGIRIDLPTIVEEMAAVFNLNAGERFAFPAAKNMRRVNTRSRSYLADTTSTESVLSLAKS